jgi:hypothetical protein
LRADDAVRQQAAILLECPDGDLELASKEGLVRDREWRLCLQHPYPDE